VKLARERYADAVDEFGLELDFTTDSAGTLSESKALREQLEALGNQLVWKIGKDEISERVIVRVGYANATQSFRDLPRLRGATDAEIADAAKQNELVVEWIE
jgi:hypothetical protein